MNHRLRGGTLELLHCMILMNIEQSFQDIIQWFQDAWEWIKNAFSFIFPYALGALLLYLLYISIVAFKNRDETAQKLGYKDYKDWRMHRAEKRQLFLDNRKYRKEKARELTTEQNNLLSSMRRIWQEENVESLNGVANEAFIQQARQQVQKLNQNGIKRDFQFNPDPTINEFHHDIELADDGKIERGLTSVFGESTFLWLDRTNGNVLAKKNLAFSEIQFALASGIRDKATGDFICINCGGPIDAENDDVIHCPYCHSISYREDYSNLITQMNLYSFNKLQEGETRISTFILRYSTIISLFLAVIYLAFQTLAPIFVHKSTGMLANFFNWFIQSVPNVATILQKIGIPEEVSSVVGNFLPITLFYFVPQLLIRIQNLFQERRQKIERERMEHEARIHKFKKMDKLFSVDLAKSEMLMMFQSIRMNAESEDQKVWGVYTTPEHRTDIRNEFAKQNEAIDMIVNQVLLDDIWQESDGSIRIRFYVDYDLLQYNQSNFRLNNHKSLITLSKNRNGKTILLEGESTAKCPNCAAPVQLLNQDSCNYCQTGFHRDEMYWRINTIAKAKQAPKVLIDESGSRRNSLKRVLPFLK